MKQGKNKRNNTQNLKEYIQQFAQTGIKELTDIVFPPACPVCGGVLGFEKGRRRQICPDCDNRLEYIGEPRCMKCGKPLKKTDTQQFCYDCTVKRHFYERGVAVFAYTDGIKQSIYQFKYHDKREYAAFYGRQAAQQCGALIGKWDIDLVLPVPMYAAKQRKRGYNQAELIARELSKNLNLICASEILVRTRKTTPMKELNDEERRKNVERAFLVKENVVKYKKILLVDDIYTTGATIDSCAKILCVRGKDFKKMPGTAEGENWLWMLEIADNVGNYIII